MDACSISRIIYRPSVPLTVVKAHEILIETLKAGSTQRQAHLEIAKRMGLFSKAPPKGILSGIFEEIRAAQLPIAFDMVGAGISVQNIEAEHAQDYFDIGNSVEDANNFFASNLAREFLSAVQVSQGFIENGLVVEEEDDQEDDQKKKDEDGDERGDGEQMEDQVVKNMGTMQLSN